MKFPLIGRPRRTVPAPEPPPRHQSQNPLFQPSSLPAWRARVLGWTAVVVVLAGVGWWVYGPSTRLTDIQVQGTVFVSPDSVKAVAEHYLNRWRWLILYQRQSVLVQTGALANNIRHQIEERIAVKDVSVDIVGRHELIITIRERVPVALWVSSGSTGWLDDTGTIVQRGQPGSGLTLVPLRDESAQPFQPGQQVVVPAVVQSLITLNDAFTRSALTVGEYRLPVVTCLKLPEPEPETSNLNTNGNKNANVNVPVANLNRNRTVMNGSANTNSDLPCDPAELRKTRPEIDAVLKDGPLIKFDRFTNLTQAVGTLKSILAESSNSGATVIDLRFGDRVFIR